MERPVPPAAPPGTIRHHDRRRADPRATPRSLDGPRAEHAVTRSSAGPGTRPELRAVRHRASAGRSGSGLGVTLAIVALGVVGLRLYLDTQWFVGVSNGRVAIFRGVPTEVGRVRAALGRGRDLDPGGGGPGPRVVPGPPRRASRPTIGRRGRDRGEHPRGRRPLRAAHVVSRVAAPRRPHIARAARSRSRSSRCPVDRRLRDRRVRQARAAPRDVRALRDDLRGGLRRRSARRSARSRRAPTPRCSPRPPSWSGSASR